jgi:hypothetical protein
MDRVRDHLKPVRQFNQREAFPGILVGPAMVLESRAAGREYCCNRRPSRRAIFRN